MFIVSDSIRKGLNFIFMLCLIFHVNYRTYLGTYPFLVIEDLDIIKVITVKEFNKFIDRFVRTPII